MLFCEPCASYVCKIKFTQDDLEEFENTLRLCASARDCIKLHFLRALRLCVMQLISTNAQKLSPIAACSPANCGLFFSFATSLRLCAFARDCILFVFLASLAPSRDAIQLAFHCELCDELRILQPLLGPHRTRRIAAFIFLLRLLRGSAPLPAGARTRGVAGRFARARI